MIRSLLTIIFFTCVYASAYTQVNFVKNPSIEEYRKCPDGWNQIHYANGWRNNTDSIMMIGADFYNVCGNVMFSKNAHLPDNGSFWQNPRTGNGIAGCHFFNDKSMPLPSPLPFNYRDNLQGHLINPLITGKTYCVSFWVNSAEAAGYVHNKIGAYLDNGSINFIVDTAGEEITSVIP